MSWILGLMGALLGVAMIETSRGFFGLVIGALVGALLGQASRLRRRVSDLEARLAKAEARANRPAAAQAPAPAATSAAAMAERAVPADGSGGAPGPETAGAPAATAPADVRAAPLPGEDGTPARAVFDLPQPPDIPVGAAAGPTPSAQPSPSPAAARPAAAAAPPQLPPIQSGPREPDVFERAIAVAKGWLFEGNVPVKLGLLVLMFGVASALKYAADAGWLRMPIEYRLAGIAAGAIAGLVWGLRSAAQRPAFGLSMQGGAIGVLLLTVFAAFRLYQVVDPMPAFVMVIILVAGASVLAVRQNAPALAVLGFIGGYLAPVLISTGSGNHVALFSYYAVLNLAVFLIAWKRPWRALNLVGFLFTFAIGGAWGAEYYRPALFNTVEPFLVLFFLFYVAIPVLYALAGREKNGKVDGTLLFGTPLLAFPMQAALLADQPDTLPMALSAVVVAAIYAGLALWARRNVRLQVLAQSSAAMGVVFVTLAIPLALSARWTSAAWALQGVGMVWLGLRQARRLTRWTGLLLLFLAAIAWCWSLFDTRIDMADRFLANGHAVNLALLALTALGASWLYEKRSSNRFLPIALFLVGMFWWCVLGLREIEVNLDPVSDATAYGLFAAITALLAALLRRPLDWPRLSWPVIAASGASLLLSLAALESWQSTWFAPPLLAWWAITAMLLLSLRPLLAPRSRGLAFAHLPVLAMLALCLGLSMNRWMEYQAGLADGWLLPGSLLPAALLFVGAWRWPQWAAWPVAEAFPGWRVVWLLLAGIGLSLGWLVGQFMPGDSAPLPWLPVLNPLELTLLLGLLVGARELRIREARGEGKALWAVWAGAAMLTLTMSVLRACHHLAQLPWSPELLSSRIAQASLTVAWCLAGMLAWILGSRRHNRPLWMVGAGLLGVVLLKLMFVDRQFLGNVTGIASFVAVGMLLIIVGRIAPTPPRSESN